MATISNMETLYIGLATNIQKSTVQLNNLNKALTAGIPKINKFSTNIIGLTTDFSHLATKMSTFSNKFTAVVGKVNKGSSAFHGFSSSLDKVQQKASNTMNKIKSLGESAEKSIKKISLAESKVDKINKASDNSKKAAPDNNVAAYASKPAKPSLGIGNMLKSAFNMDNIKQGMAMTDQYINMSKGLAKINDGSQSQGEFQNSIYKVANGSHTKYSDMASAVTQLGSSDTFKSNNDLVEFADLMQKSLKMGGTDQTLDQVSSAMSDGKLQGDEFGSLMNNATISDAMTKSTGKSTDELMAMADQGAITADMLKNAMLSASDDINNSFEEEPMTFADVWTQVSNDIMQALTPLMEFINNLLNSSPVQAALNWISQAVSNLVNFIVNNGAIIQAIIIAVGAILLYVLACSAVGWIMMYLPILLIIGAIALVIYILNQMGVSFSDILGFVGGLIGTLVAFVINYITYLWNCIAIFVNFFGNVFKHPIASLQTAFLDMAVNILGIFASLVKGIETLLNKIPGVNLKFSSDITNLKDNLAAKSTDIKNKAGLKTYMKTKDYADFSKYAGGGSKIGKQAGNVIGGAWDKTNNTLTGKSNKSDKALFGSRSNKALTNSTTGKNLKSNVSDIGTKNKPLSIQGTGSNGSVGVQMNNEDLSYLRDMAERDYIANVATNTLAPNITVSFGDVHENADANQIYGRIRKILKEEIAVASEGVY